MLRNFGLASVAIILFAADRFSKYLMLKLPRTEGVFDWPFVSLTPVLNPGLSFSLPFPNLLTALLTAAIIIFLVYLLIKSPGRQINWPLTLIIIGAFSNLFDRIKLGGVLDFINLPFWPLFNLADSYIAIGALWLILALRKSYSSALKTASGSRTKQEDSR